LVSLTLPHPGDGLIILAGTAATPALAGSVDFANISNGALVSNPVALDFSVEGMEVRPASEGIQEGVRPNMSDSPNSMSDSPNSTPHLVLE
jgi:hypothetical protein